MRKFINNVLKREEDVEMCDSCGKIVELEKDHCPRCGTKTSINTSTPEDGMK